jgi:hypothetical protein
MKSARLLAFVLASIAAPVCAQESDPARLFTHEAELRIDASAGALTRVVLPGEVLARTRPDLSDLRVHDARGVDVPFVVDSGARPWPSDATLPRYTIVPSMLDRSIENADSAAPRWREVLRFLAPTRAPDGARWTMSIGSSRASFVRTYVVRATADGRELARGTIFRLQDPLRERLSIDLPIGIDGEIELEIEGEAGYVEPTIELGASRAVLVPRAFELALSEIAREQRGGTSIIELSRPVGIAPDRLRIAARGTHFYRTVRVFDARMSESPRELGSGAIYRVAEIAGAEVLEIDLAPARGETLRIEITDGDSPPLEGLRFEAVVRQPTIVFAAPGGAARLRFGGGRAHAAHYDVQRFAGMMIGEEMFSTYLPISTVGEVRENPRYDGAPALRFAMRAGRALDPARYTHVAPLTIASAREGLSRVRLSPELLAAANVDLSDLRIVDRSGRQWPYLVAPHEDRDLVRTRVVRAGDEDDGTRYAITLPASRARIDRVLLHTRAPFVSRSYVLRGIDEDGRRTELARGEMHRDPELTHPIEIALVPTRISDLELLVSDGSDAPIVFDRAELSLPSASLFVAAPEGAYRVFAGDPESAPPRYEIERARELVLAVRATDGSLGRVAQNPAHVPPPWYSAANLQTWIVWIALVIAVLVLALLTLRLARSDEKPPPPPAGDPPKNEEPPPDKPSEDPPTEGRPSTEPLSF